MQAIDLQRVLDGEKAQRGDATRRLMEVARQTTRLQQLGADGEPTLSELATERAKLEQRVQQHTAQVL